MKTPGNKLTKPEKLRRRLLPVVLFSVAFLSLLELFKHLFFPDLDALASHVATVFLSAVIATLVAHFFVRNRDQLYMQAWNEISAREKAEAALAESQKRNEALTEAIPDMIFLIDKEGVYLDVKLTKQIAPLVPPSVFLGRKMTEVLPADIAGLSMEYIRKTLATGGIHAFEYQLPGEGGLRDYEARLVAAGANRVLAIIRDITEKKEAEQELHFKSVLLDSAIDSIIVYDTEGKVIYANESAYKTRGYTGSEFLTKRLADLVAPDPAATLDQRMEELLKSGRAIFETAHVKKDGSIMPVEAHTWVIEYGNNKVIVSVVRDITARKLAEEEREKTRRTQEILNKLLNFALEDLPLTGQLNRALDIILSAPFMPLEPRGAIFLTRNDNPELALTASRNFPAHLTRLCGKVPFGECICGKVAGGGQMIFTDRLDERHEHRHPEMTPHGHYCVPMISQAEQGKVLGVIALYVRPGHKNDPQEEAFLQAVSDTLAGIIERRQVQDAVAQSEQRYRTLAESAPDYVFIIDRNFRLEYINGLGAGRFRQKPEAVLKKPIHELFGPEAFEGIKDNLEAAFHSDVPLSFEDFLHFPGYDLWLDTKLVPLRDNGRVRAVMGVARDITERKRAQFFSDALNEINTTINSTLEYEEIMQRVADGACRAVGSESAMILVREEDDWVIKYGHNLPSKRLGAKLTDEEAKASTLVAKTNKPLIVLDALTDPRVNAETMKEFKIRSMLAVPLTVKDDAKGVLIFQYHTKTADFEPAAVDFAGKLATSLSLAIENADLYAQERNIADTLQESLLTMPHKIVGLDFGYLYRSATAAKAEVGGDFYDIFELENGRVGIVVGDVSGKGLEAATLTSLVKNTIRAYAYEGGPPASVIARAGEVLTRSSDPAVFTTVFFGVLHPGSGRLEYCSAGHPPAIVRAASSETRLLRADSPAIGIFPGLDYFSHDDRLMPGDVLLLYTDGVIEARRADAFFGQDKLLSLVQGLQTTSPAKIPQLVFNAIVDFTNGTLSDDIALVAVAPAERT